MYRDINTLDTGFRGRIQELLHYYSLPEIDKAMQEGFGEQPN